MKLGINHISASGHIGFGKYGGPNGCRLRRPQKINLVWSTSVPNFMLVDKSAQYPPKKSLRLEQLEPIRTIFLRTPYIHWTQSDQDQGHRISEFFSIYHNVDYYNYILLNKKYNCYCT